MGGRRRGGQKRGSRPGFHGEGADRERESNCTPGGKHQGILQAEKYQWDATVLGVWGQGVGEVCLSGLAGGVCAKSV